MRASLPFRILVVHLLFGLAAFALAIVLVRDAFVRYQNSWERRLETVPGETLYQNLAGEVARSLLLRARRDTVPERIEIERGRVSEALDVLLEELPSFQAMLIVDMEGRILYASDPDIVDFSFNEREQIRRFSGNDVKREPFLDQATDEILTELIVPVFESSESDVRLGTLVARYAPDPELLARLPDLTPPSISFQQFAWPVIWFLGVTALGAIWIAWLSGLPIRRLERAVEDFRERDYRGGLGAEPLAFGGDFSRAIRALNELGGRLEELDTREDIDESELEGLVPRLDQGMLVLDPDGKPRGWNPAALVILAPHAVDADAETAERAIRERLAEHPELARPPRTGRVAELRLAQAAGGETQVGVTRVPFEGAPGERGTLLLLRDHDALQEVEGRLVEAGRFATLAHIAAGLAHEIRNPLHAIGLNAEVVGQYLDAPAGDRRKRAATEESLRAVKDETRRLTDLLNNYLGLVRPERSASSVNLAALCRKVRQLLAYSAAQAGVRIELELDPELPAIDGFASRLQQAVMNLVLNAIQAMKDGGTVRLRVAAVDDDVEIVVEDDGPGLPDDLQDGIFVLRATTKPEGSGIGLPLVRRVVEAHRGSIDYAPGPEGGARFRIRLPRSPALAEA